MTTWRASWRGVRQNARIPGFWDQPSYISSVLLPLSWAFTAATTARWAITRPFQSTIPVVCVGNLVLGGAGKTPTALTIAKWLSKSGHTPHFLSRGYRGHLRGLVRVDLFQHTAAEVGDESLLLANVAPTWISKNRRISARAAIKAGATILVMDDGFQNPGLKKDVSIIVIDSGFGHGNGRLFPAGPLREKPASGLARANAVIIVDDQATNFVLPDTGGLPILKAYLAPTEESSARLGSGKVIGFCGIGRPEKFFQSLRGLGCDVLETHKFPDHHPYSVEELERLRSNALAIGARLVTTTKDLARIPNTIAESLEVLEVDLKFADPTALSAVLAPVMKS